MRLLVFAALVALLLHCCSARSDGTPAPMLTTVPTVRPEFQIPLAQKYGLLNYDVSPVRCDGLACFIKNKTTVLSFDATNGNILWRTESPSFTTMNLPHVGHGLLAFSQDNILDVFDSKTGEKKYSANLGNYSTEWSCAGPAIFPWGVAVQTNRRLVMFGFNTNRTLWETQQTQGRPGHCVSSRANRFAQTHDRLFLVVNQSVVAVDAQTGHVNFSTPLLRQANGSIPNVVGLDDIYATKDAILVSWTNTNYLGDGFVSSVHKATGELGWVATFTPASEVYTAMISASEKHTSFSYQELAHGGLDQYTCQTTCRNMKTGDWLWSSPPFLCNNQSNTKKEPQSIVLGNYGGDAYVFSSVEKVMAANAETGDLMWESPLVSNQNWASFGIAESTAGLAYAVAPVSFNGNSTVISSWRIN